MPFEIAVSAGNVGQRGYARSQLLALTGNNVSIAEAISKVRKNTFSNNERQRQEYLLQKITFLDQDISVNFANIPQTNQVHVHSQIPIERTQNISHAIFSAKCQTICIGTSN